MKNKLVEHLTLAAVNASALATAALYSRLPERVPVHFDVHGVPDGFAPRAVGAALLPGLAFALWLFLRFAPLASQTSRMRAPAARAVTALVILLLASIHGVVLYSALHDGAPVGGPFGVVLGVFWVILGLLMPRLRRNRFVGIRVPWTLASDEVWARTHRFGGAAMVAGGLAAIGAVAMGRGALALMFVIASALLPIVYAAILAREVPPAA